MPSPRAILADITDLGIDPSKKHSNYSSSGRLRKLCKKDESVCECVDKIDEPEVVEEKKEVVEEVVDDVKVEKAKKNREKFANLRSRK